MENEIVTVRQFSIQNPTWSENSIRWLIFNRDKNGLEQSGALIRTGRRVLIDRPAFFSWVRNENVLPESSAEWRAKLDKKKARKSTHENAAERLRYWGTQVHRFNTGNYGSRLREDLLAAADEIDRLAECVGEP